jgi:hypothetical protein
VIALSAADEISVHSDGGTRPQARVPATAAQPVDLPPQATRQSEEAEPPLTRRNDTIELPLPVWANELITDLANSGLIDLQPFQELLSAAPAITGATGWPTWNQVVYGLMGAAVLVLCYHEFPTRSGVERWLRAAVRAVRRVEAT